MYGSIFIQICAVGSKRCIFSAPECVLAVQGRSGSSKVDDFGTNRKRVYDFLLVGHWDYGPTLHRFRDMVTYWLKIAYFCYPSLIRRPRSLCSSWNFAVKSSVLETRVMGLSSSEDRMIVAGVVLAWYRTVTDGQTDGQTESIMANTALCWRAVKTYRLHSDFQIFPRLLWSPLIPVRLCDVRCSAVLVWQFCHFLPACVKPVPFSSF